MLVVKINVLDEFVQKHPQSGKSIYRWLRITEKAQWKNLTDIRTDFNAVDYVNGIYIFNLKGNNYRLIADIIFISQTVFIISVCTHAQYNRINFNNTDFSKTYR